MSQPNNNTWQTELILRFSEPMPACLAALDDLNVPYDLNHYDFFVYSEALYALSLMLSNSEDYASLKDNTTFKDHAEFLSEELFGRYGIDVLRYLDEVNFYKYRHQNYRRVYDAN